MVCPFLRNTPPKKSINEFCIHINCTLFFNTVEIKSLASFGVGPNIKSILYIWVIVGGNNVFKGKDRPRAF